MTVLRALRRTVRSRLAGVPDKLKPWRPRHAVVCARAYALDRANRRSYVLIDEGTLRASKRSDIAFIFGSGKSLLDISPEEWERIAEHDTIGFSQFQEQRYVRVDYHLISEAVNLDRYARLFRENPFYRSTIYAVQTGWLAHIGNEIVGRRMLPAGSSVFRFSRRARGRYEPPSRRFSRGLVHGYNSSISTTNFALLTGWKRIVLVGVDLYDREYFYLPSGGAVEGEKPGRTPSMKFPGADAVVEYFRRWQPIVAATGASLEVYNPRSLLTEALDVFSWERTGAAR